MKHILIEGAKPQIKATKESLEPFNIDASYSQKIGLWVALKDDTPWIDHPEFSGPKTKKFDVESGEDEKGR